VAERLWPANCTRSTLFSARRHGALRQPARTFRPSPDHYELFCSIRGPAPARRSRSDRRHRARRALIDVRPQASSNAEWLGESADSRGETSPLPFASNSARVRSRHIRIRVTRRTLAVRGGSWGTDDSRKAHLAGAARAFFAFTKPRINIIRNWLAPEHRGCVLRSRGRIRAARVNDSGCRRRTSSWSADPQLFSTNARDCDLALSKSSLIAVWFGRNEAVPQRF